MNKKWIKIDPHVHSKGISSCSIVTCEQIIDEKIKLGYDGAVLTNHCQSWYYTEDKHAQFMEQMIAEFQRGKIYADKKGLRIKTGRELYW